MISSCLAADIDAPDNSTEKRCADNCSGCYSTIWYYLC